MNPRLKIFLTCAEQMSFTSAAKILNMTQPAVTFQIKKLEQEFKTALFYRDNNRIQLTPPGNILYEHGKIILDEYEAAKEKIFQISGDLTGEIRLGITDPLNRYLLPRLIGHFKQKYMHVAIKMLVGNSEMLIENLKDHQLDLAVVSEPITYQRFIVKPLIDDNMVIVVNPEHRWAKRGEIELEELITEPFVDREPGSGSRAKYESFFIRKGLNLKQFNTIITMGNVEAVKSYVESGECFGIVSSIAVQHEIETGILKRIEITDTRGGTIFRKFLVVYPVRPYNKHLINIFVNTLTEELHKIYPPV